MYTKLWRDIVKLVKYFINGVHLIKNVPIFLNILYYIQTYFYKSFDKK